MQRGFESEWILLQSPIGLVFILKSTTSAPKDCGWLCSLATDALHLFVEALSGAHHREFTGSEMH